METVIYILGQSYCGSTALGFALGNHDDITFLGETKAWMYGRILPGKKAVVDFNKPPDTKFVVDSSKSFWRLKQWYRTKYTVKIIWLRRPLWQCVRSRLKRKRIYTAFQSLTIPFIVRLINALYIFPFEHATVSLSELSRHSEAAKQYLIRYLGVELPNLYTEFDPSIQNVFTCNIVPTVDGLAQLGGTDV